MRRICRYIEIILEIIYIEINLEIMYIDKKKRLSLILVA